MFNLARAGVAAAMVACCAGGWCLAADSDRDGKVGQADTAAGATGQSAPETATAPAGADKNAAEDKAKEEARKRLEQALDRKISVDFTDVTLSAALAKLRTLTQLEFTLVAVSDPEPKFTLRAQETPAAAVLRRVMDLTGCEAVWSRDAGAVLIRKAPLAIGSGKAALSATTTSAGPATVGTPKKRAGALTRSQTLEALDRKLTLSFAETPLEDAIAHLRNATGLNFLIAPDVDTKKEITLQVTEMTTANVLRYIMELTGYHATWKHEAVLITGQAEAGCTELRIYPLTDLLTNYKSRYPPSTDDDEKDDEDDDKAENKAEAREKLLEIIKKIAGGEQK